MAIPATQLRPGMIIKHNNDLHSVFSVEHRTPGNLRAFIQAKLRNLRTGAMFEHRFRSPDAVVQFPACDVGFGDVDSGAGVGYFTHASHLIFVRLSNEHDVVAPGGHEVAHDVQKLPGEVLMDKQELQSDYPV